MTERQPLNEQLEVLRIVCRRLVAQQIPYMVTGSIAASHYARPRMTRDIDIVIDVEVIDAGRIHSLFSEDFHADPLVIESEIERRGMFNILHQKYFVKVDFIVRKRSEYRELEFARRRTTEIEDFQCTLVSIEDLILSKLAWARESLSETQLTDVKQLLTFAAKIDLDYIENWVQRLGLGEVYRRIEK